MKIKLGELRRLVREAGVIAASSGYMKKERVREQLQEMICSAVRSGEVTDKRSLDEFIKSLEISVTALKMIPFEVWSKISEK